MCASSHAPSFVATGFRCMSYVPRVFVTEHFAEVVNGCRDKGERYRSACRVSVSYRQLSPVLEIEPVDGLLYWQGVSPVVFRLVRACVAKVKVRIATTRYGVVPDGLVAVDGLLYGFVRQPGPARVVPFCLFGFWDDWIHAIRSLQAIQKSFNLNFDAFGQNSTLIKIYPFRILVVFRFSNWNVL